MKNVSKAGELVKIKIRKLTTGASSLFLEYKENGERKRVSTGLFLVNEKTTQDKETNKLTFRYVNIIKAQKTTELINEEAGIKHKASKISLLFYFDKIIERKKGKETSTGRLYISTKKYIKGYRDIQLCNIDKTYLEGFANFLRGKEIKESTVKEYYTKLVCVLNEAVREGLIDSNPAMRVSNDIKPKAQEAERCYLNVDEVEMLIKTPCKNEEVKRAFLFSCFTGLRFSDLIALKYSEIHENKIFFKQQKTQRQNIVPLSDEALKYLPNGSGENFAFNLPTNQTVNVTVHKWSKSAGINKDVTFHTARHTNATLLLTAGVDLYTVSKLLGHTDIKTTEIYAKVIDSKKSEAVGKLDKFFKQGKGE